MNDPTTSPLVPAGSVPITSWAAYEQAAANNMRRFGFPDAAVTPSGADGGIDVRASGAVAQVNGAQHGHTAARGPAAAWHRRREGKLGVFFSLRRLHRWSDRMGRGSRVALFVLRVDRHHAIQSVRSQRGS